MSYLSELLHRQLTATQALAKSVGYLKRKVGLAPSDDQVDSAVAAAESAAKAAAAVAQKALAGYIAAHVPMLPADVIAATATTAALNVIDAAIAGAGNVIKANN